jgi:hypothetical protein
MKVGLYLYGLALCGVLTTGTAIARHQGHQFRHPTTAKSHAPGGVQAGTDGDMNHRGEKATATGGAENSSHGREADAMAKRGESKAGTEAEIDVRIAVHQGREKRKNVQQQLFKKKSSIAVGAAQTWSHPKPFWRSAHRNAIGAIAAHDHELPHPAVTSGLGTEPVAGANKPPLGKPSVLGAPILATKAEAVGGPAYTPVANPSGTRIEARTENPVTPVGVSPMNINGAGLNRPAFTTAAITGSPKVASGSISGNSVHLKHP